jgi:cobalt-zinc-cadmium resistance protein CzcA
MQVSLANEQAARQWVLVEQAQNRPEFSVGINSISVTGWFSNRANTNQKFYNIGNRFQSVVVGVHFPLFAKGLKQRVEAARQLAVANSLQTRELQYQLQVQLQELQQRYQLANLQWRQHRQNALPQANLIQAGIQSRLKAGSINFLEYSTAFQQVQQTRLRLAELRYQLELLLADYQYYISP